MRLSKPQKRFLITALSDERRERPTLAPDGFSTAGRAASAWARTARSLQRLGLLRLRWPQARLTADGRDRALAELADS